MNCQIKINRKIYTITDKDRIIFNSSVYILVTQKEWNGYSQYSPTVPKKYAVKWIKDNALVLCGTYKGTFGSTFPLYKFVKEVEQL